MSTEYITLRVNNARRANNVPIILRDLATRTNMPNRGALRVRAGFNSVILYGVKIPNNYCQMSELNFKVTVSDRFVQRPQPDIDLICNTTTSNKRALLKEYDSES